MNLEEAFSQKRTENGDIAFTHVGNDPLLNILFLTEYYTNHLDEVPEIGESDRERLFSMFVRDPRNGLGRRGLGRVLMHMSNCSIDDIVNAGRVDDLFIADAKTRQYVISSEILDWLKSEIENGNDLVKKWMPRYHSKNVCLARNIAKYWGMSKQEYGHFIKCDSTVESKLSDHHVDEIVFEHVPSLALLKYYKRFESGDDTGERFSEYLESVRKGEKKMNVSATNVYDIYRKRYTIDADLFFSKIEKIQMSVLPIVDTSGSMRDDVDSMGKALAIGHYLAKCSTYAPDKVVSFSSHPALLTLGIENHVTTYDLRGFQLHSFVQHLNKGVSKYVNEIESMYTGDYSNTNFGGVMEIMKSLDEYPDYIVVLSDMEFDRGSNTSKNELEQLWKENGCNTKIVWWNLNPRNITVPEMDHMGNIYMSGYSPMLLGYLEAGFDGKSFLDKLLKKYENKMK